MTDETILENAVAYITELFRENADGHDADHSLRVYRNALSLAAHYPACDRMAVALAALLHDADDHKLFRTGNNENARRFLKAQQVDEEKTDRICEIINAVSFSKNRGKTPATLEGRIVQDADRLDAIGAIGIARTFAFGGKAGRPMDESVQHFFDKLLLLKGTMNTPEARAMAEARHAYVEQFLAELAAERNGER